MIARWENRGLASMERAWWIYLRGDQGLKTTYSKTDDHLENIHVHLISTSLFYVLMTPF